MPPRRILLAALVTLFVLGTYFFMRSGRYSTYQAPIPGAIAPDFSLPQLDGVPLQLSAYRRKVVLLDFWATWCEPCQEEIPLFIRLQDEYGQQGLQIVAISMDDSSDPVRDLYQRSTINYRVVMGNAKIGELYGGVLGLPVAFLIGPDGRIKSKHIGAIDASSLRNEILNLLQSPNSSKSF